MFGFIEKHQLNIMLALCAVSAVMALFLLITKYLSKRRKWILIFIELIATGLLGFDRAAYIYKGDVSHKGYIMVRLANFMVFFLTSAIVLIFNQYLSDLLMNEGRLEKLPKRISVVNAGAAAGMIMVVISNFTGLYYTFDENNNYQRGPGFLICYIVPVVFPIVQYTVIRRYRRHFSRLIYISLVMYLFVPIAMGIIQIFTYGISIVNMAMVMVSVSLYIFTYLDVNASAEKAHETEVGDLQKEQMSMKRLFDQTVTAFVAAVEKRDKFSEGHSVRVAELARKIARTAGRDEEMCEEVYYAALLHDVGMIGIPDSVIYKTEGFTKEELKQKERKPVISAEILQSITEYPYLSRGARYSCERYDGTGYPEGLSGTDIPEISRIIAVADAYDTMITGKRTHVPVSSQAVREEFIKMSGTQFDPEFAEIMVNLMDKEGYEKYEEEITKTESELYCGEYRESVCTGIPVTEEQVKIHFDCESTVGAEGGFFAPSMVFFDSYDRHIHDEAKTIEAYKYTEFGEMWTDGHYVCTNARNMAVNVTEGGHGAAGYDLTAGRYEDHLSVRMVCADRTVEMTMALPDNSKASYIGLTGENCHFYNIGFDKTGKVMTESDIRKIVSRQSFTDRLESDLPNIQADHTRSASTRGIELEDELVLDFHTMSLPSADLVWHCPYVVLFYSDDGTVSGGNYREYTMIKLNGESSGSGYADNDFRMKKTSLFPGWDEWKRINKEGMECSVKLVKKGSRVIMSTENLGIVIENVTTLHEGEKQVYAALTGDEVALTDIRVR